MSALRAPSILANASFILLWSNEPVVSIQVRAASAIGHTSDEIQESRRGGHFCRISRFAIRAVSTIAMVSTMLTGSTGSAQDGSEDADQGVWAGVEEMLVTGGTTALLIPTGTSVTGFDAATLQAIGAEDISDLAAFVPNLEIRTGSGTTASFFIRGVGLQDFGANATSAVAIFQDGVSVNSPALQLVGLFDLEGVSVLRGPQATGSNRNASAGAIKLVSRKPSGQNEGNLRFSNYRIVSNDAFDAERYELEGGLGTSIIEDVLSSRIAFRFVHKEPMWENGCGGALPLESRPPGSVCGENFSSVIPVGLPRRVGEGDEWAARGQLRFQPAGEAMDFILKFEGSRVDRDSTTGQSLGTGNRGDRVGQRDSNTYRDQDITAESAALEAAGFSRLGGSNSPLAIALEDRLLDRPLDKNPFRGDINRIGLTRVETLGVSLSSSVDFDRAQLESHVGYHSYNRREDTDTDQTPNTAFEVAADDDGWQFFGDVALSGDVGLADELRWNVGAYYLTEDLELAQDTFLGTAFFNTRRAFRQEIQSFGVWAGFEMDFWENFTFEAGGRYNLEQKEFEVFEKRGFLPPESRNDEQLWTAPTWIASLTYRFTEDVSTFFKYSRGFKAGHFNSNNAKADSADPELLDSYEWGVEVEAWESRVRFNAQFFYYDYQDYQVFLLEDSPTSFPSLEVRNADDAINFGAEAELVLQPLIGIVPEAIEGLKFEIRPGWLKTRFLDFVDTELRVAGGALIPVEVDFSGNPLPSAPSFQVSGSIDWPFDMGRYGRIIPRWDFAWTDDVAFDPASGEGSVDFQSNTRHPSYTIGQKAYATHNVRIDYRFVDEAGAGFQLAGWCRNVTDVRFKQFSADVSAFQQQILNFVGDPRTCGADISLTW